MIELLGKGAVPDADDIRDYVVKNGIGAALINWSQEFRLPEPPAFDQKSSDCCVACAWSYYHWQLKGKAFSKRDLFCRIALSYGAEIRAGGLAVKNSGQADNNEVKDPGFPTAANMRDSSGTNQSFRNDDLETDCFVLQDQTIDGVAWGIENYKGVVFGVVGSNEGWKDIKNPRPPAFGEKTWGHALYAFGHHLHNGVKCIIAKSSWSSTNEHHIRQDYFQALEMTFNAWTLIPKGTYMNDHAKLINYKGTVFLAIGAKDIPQLVALGDAFGKPVQVAADGKTVTNIDITVQ